MLFSFGLCWAYAFIPLLIILCTILKKTLHWWQGYLVLSTCLENIPKYKQIPIILYYQQMKLAFNSKNSRTYWFQLLEGLSYLYRKEGICMFWIGPRPFIICFKAEMIETVVNDASSMSKSVEYNFLNPWLGTGLLTSTGEKWRKHRKLLTPCFHFQILENFIPVFNEQAQILTSKLELEVEKSSTNIEPLITMCTLEIVCQTIMGVQQDIQSGHGEDYVQSVEILNGNVFYRTVRPWLWSDSVFFYLFPSGWQYRKSLKTLHDFTKKVIKKKKVDLLKESANKRTQQNVTKKKKAFLELLLECHLKDESFTEENVREEVDTFMFEGHDTTSSAIIWTLYILGCHSDVQDKVFQELCDIFQSDCERPVEYEDLKRMKYLECVIKESMRLFPPVPLVGRQVKKKLQVGNYTLMPGCTSILLFYSLHRDPDVFLNPQSFKPDRFSPENSNKRHPYAYIPFSAGPRNCIGQKFALLELKTVLSHILRKFKVESLIPRDKMDPMVGLVLKSAEPVKIKFSFR